MPKVKVLWTTGNYGAKVALVKRGAFLSLRYTRDDQHDFVPLKHSDETRGREQARELSRNLANARASESGAPGAHRGLTVGELFTRYKRDVTAYKNKVQAAEDERRRIIWLHVLGATRKATSVTPSDVEQYIAKRRQGLIVIDELNLKAKPKPRTIDADVVWLQAVYNWASRAKLVTGKPLEGVLRPDVPTQLRPVADAARYDDLMKIAEWAHPLFGLLLTSVRYLGWRISAICQIDGRDIQYDASEHAPFGRIRKNWETDKEKVEAWLPMPKPLRDALLSANAPASGPIFPAEKNPEKSFDRFYARKLLWKAEDIAGLDGIQGGDWHPYRRLWATERKPLPTSDVAAAGGWADQRTMQKYQQADPATTASVMLFGTEKQTKPRTTPRTRTSRTISPTTKPRE